MRLGKREIDWNVVAKILSEMLIRVMRKAPMQAIHQQASLKFGVSESVIRAEMRRRKL